MPRITSRRSGSTNRSNPSAGCRPSTRPATAHSAGGSAGSSSSCKNGRRRNDYELRRGRLLAKSGDGPQARDVFERLLARVPGELNVVGAAAEAMLGAKQAKDARQFAEQGLSRARAQNNRDSEGYFL